MDSENLEYIFGMKKGFKDESRHFPWLIFIWRLRNEYNFVGLFKTEINDQVIVYLQIPFN